MVYVWLSLGEEGGGVYERGVMNSSQPISPVGNLGLRIFLRM